MLIEKMVEGSPNECPNKLIFGDKNDANLGSDGAKDEETSKEEMEEMKKEGTETAFSSSSVIPDVLLNELNEILCSPHDNASNSSSSEEDEDEEESWDFPPALDSIPEESETEWDSDSSSTLTEFSLTLAHAPTKERVSTQQSQLIQAHHNPPLSPAETSHSALPQDTRDSGIESPENEPSGGQNCGENCADNKSENLDDLGENLDDCKTNLEEFSESCKDLNEQLEKLGENPEFVIKSVENLTENCNNLDESCENHEESSKKLNENCQILDYSESEDLKTEPEQNVLENLFRSSPSPSTFDPLNLTSDTYINSCASEYFVVKLRAEEQQRTLDLVDLSSFCFESFNLAEGGKELSKFIEENTAGLYFSDNTDNGFSNLGRGEDKEKEIEAMHTRHSTSCSEHQHLPPGIPREKPRSVLRKPGAAVKKSGRNVSFNESLNLFYEAECQCWVHEEDYARFRHEEHIQQQLIYEQAAAHYHQHHGHGHYLAYEPPPLEFEDTPTLSPPEGYKDRFFPQMANAEQLQAMQMQQDPDVTRAIAPSPPTARRKVFLKETDNQNSNHHRPILNGLEEEEDNEDNPRGKNNRSRFGGILKGGRLWRSNSSENKKASSPSDEPDLVKCTERTPNDGELGGGSPLNSNPPQQQNQSQQVEFEDAQMMMAAHQQSLNQSQTQGVTKVSTGTATLRTSEQIRLAVDSTLRLSRSKKNKQECSSLVEKLRWLTSLDDEENSDSQSGFATWPARDKNGAPSSSSPASTSNSSSSRKSDAGTSTSEEFVHPHQIQPPHRIPEAKIKQLSSYTLEDIEEGLKGGENELEAFLTEEAAGGRLERIRRRYVGGEDIGGDDYGFSRRPSVKGIKPKFSSTNQIFAAFTRAGAETPIPTMQTQPVSTSQPQPPQSESAYENTRYESQQSEIQGGARVNLNYDQFVPPTSAATTAPNQNQIPRVTAAPDENRSSQFELIRQSFESGNFVSYNRPHSWSVSTLPHNHSHNHIPLPGMASGSASGGGSTLNLAAGQPQMPQNNLSGGQGQGQMVNGAINGRPNHLPQMGQMPPGGYVMGQFPGPGGQMQMQNMQMQQGIYGTVRRVPNVIGRPLFLHYGALSVEAHPNKLSQPYPATKVPETPSPTQPQPQAQQLQSSQQQQLQGPQQQLQQQQLGPGGQPIANIKYYGPPIRYYNPPPPVPPRSATTSIGSSAGNNAASGMEGMERGNPEGATDEEPSIKEPTYSMNV